MKRWLRWPADDYGEWRHFGELLHDRRFDMFQGKLLIVSTWKDESNWYEYKLVQDAIPLQCYEYSSLRVPRNLDLVIVGLFFAWCFATLHFPAVTHISSRMGTSRSFYWLPKGGSSVALLFLPCLAVSVFFFFYATVSCESALVLHGTYFFCPVLFCFCFCASFFLAWSKCTSKTFCFWPSNYFPFTGNFKADGSALIDTPAEEEMGIFARLLAGGPTTL